MALAAPTNPASRSRQPLKLPQSRRLMMTTRMEAAFAGAGIGTLIGILVGLSGSPVVAAAVGSLLGVLAAFLGFSAPATQSGDAGASERRARNAAVVSFGFAAAFSALLGIYLRANDVLSPAPATRVAAWLKADYPPETARALAALELTGLVPPGAGVEEGRVRTTSTLLYSGNREPCDKLDPASLLDAASWQLAVGQVGGAWEELGRAVARLPESEQVNILTASWRVSCGG